MPFRPTRHGTSRPPRTTVAPRHLAIDDEPNEIVATHPLQASCRTHWHSLIDRSPHGAQASAPLKPMFATSSGADVPPTARRGRQLLHDGKTTLPTLNPERCQPYRPRPVPAAAPGIHRSTTSPKDGRARCGVARPGAGRDLVAPRTTTTLRRAHTWTIHRKNQGCTRRDAAARSPLPR